jgi:hypothetical protein
MSPREGRERRHGGSGAFCRRREGEGRPGGERTWRSTMKAILVTFSCGREGNRREEAMWIELGRG